MLKSLLLSLSVRMWSDSSAGFVSLALVSKGCCMISIALFKICGEAHV